MSSINPNELNVLFDLFNKSSDEHDFYDKCLKKFGKNNVDLTTVQQYYQTFSSGGRPVNRNNRSGSFSQSFAGFGRGILQSQSINRTGGENVNIESILNAFLSGDNKLKSFPEMIGDVFGSLGDQLLTQLGQQLDLQREINEQTSLTGELSASWRDEIFQAIPYTKLIGYNFDDVAKAMSNLITSSGRFKLISSETIKNLSLQSRVFFDSLDAGVESLEQFQKVSMGASDAMKVVEDVGIETISLGLNAKTTTKTIVDNLEKMNQYGFKNGIDGLAKMVRHAQSLRFDLTKTLDLAEKVMDPDKALSLASELQVIGGALGDFNDPIKMMWMATNNVEGFQDAIVKSAESLASFDSKSGTFKVVGADLRRARAMADQFGMSVGELTNLAVQSAQRTSAAYDIMLSGAKGVSEDDKEFLTNLSQMKGGRMTITIPESLQKQFLGQTEIALRDLNDDQVKLLLDQREAFKEMTAEDLVEKQVGLVENINRNLSFVAATMRVSAGKTIRDTLRGVGLDEETIVEFTKGLSNEAARTILQTTEKGQEMIDSGIDGLKELFGKGKPEEPKPISTMYKSTEIKEETRSTSKPNEPRTVNVVMEHRPSPSTWDYLWRAAARDKGFVTYIEEKEERSYINAN